MSARVVLQASGPLPLRGTIDAASAEPMTLYISGTAWREDETLPFDLDLLIDGRRVPAQLHMNDWLTRKTLVTMIARTTLEPGTHEIVVQTNGTPVVTDGNDYFVITKM